MSDPLAAVIDAKVGEVAHEAGALGETRLMLLGGLMLADEVGQLARRARRRQRADRPSRNRNRCRRGARDRGAGGRRAEIGNHGGAIGADPLFSAPACGGSDRVIGGLLQLGDSLSRALLFAGFAVSFPASGGKGFGFVAEWPGDRHAIVQDDWRWRGCGARLWLRARRRRRSRPDQARFREIYKQLVETNTTLSSRKLHGRRPRDGRPARRPPVPGRRPDLFRHAGTPQGRRRGRDPPWPRSERQGHPAARPPRCRRGQSARTGPAIPSSSSRRTAISTAAARRT